MAEEAHKGYGAAVREFVFLAGILLLSACQPAQAPPRSFAPETGQIFAADNPITTCMRTPDHDERWTPGADDVALLDPVLIELIEYRLDEQDLTYEDTAQMRPELYRRNYYGFVQNGWRFILVCGRYDAEPIAMRDGGPEQFAAIFDTRRRIFTWFEFGYRA